MIYCTKTSGTVFISSVIFFWACSPRVHLASPLQRITIITNKNVRVIAVAGEVSPLPSVKMLSDEDLKTLQLKQLYIKTKQLYKTQRHAQKCAQKQIELKPEKISRMYLVLRDSKPLAVRLGIDSTQKTVYIKPRDNYARFLNMRYVFRVNDSLHLLDHKHWIYPRTNSITMNDSNIRISRFEPVKKGTFKITVFPGIETFNLKKDSGHYNNTGIVGIEIGADYFYRANRFLSFTVGAATDLVPLPIDYFGPGYIERGSAVYTGIRNNIVKGRFDMGYGFSLSRLYWTEIPIYGSPNLTEQKLRTTGLGLSFSGHFKLTQNFKAGILYQPNLLNINRAPAFEYQHYLTFHVTWNFAGRRSASKNSSYR